MKNLYRKAKVHPSPVSCRDACSVLRLLPVAIAALSAALPPEDQEVLAYLIARSPDVLPLKPEKETNKNRRKSGKHIEAEEGGGRGAAASQFRSPTPSSPFTRFAEADALLRRAPSTANKDLKKKKSKAYQYQHQHQHQAQVIRSHGPSFECSCFQCYTSFWSRWDASPSRQIIHEAIDLFEEHMAAVADEAEAEAEAEAAAKANSKGKSRKASKHPTTLLSLADDTVPKMQDQINLKKTVPDDKECKMDNSIVVWGEREEDSKAAPKSKQIVPFDFAEEEEVEEEEAGGRQAKKVHPEQQEAARAGACPLGGRSIIRRMFPDIMGFVADHLWTAWSSPIRASNA